MLTLYVVDKSADARMQLVGKVNRYLQADASLVSYLPQVSIKPLAIEEIKFHAAPDVCILGDGLLDEMAEIGKIRKLIPESTLWVWFSSALESFTLYEQLVALGIDDTLNVTISGTEFIQKLMLVSGRKKAVKHHSRLIAVASGKGGVGVTSVSAALAEGLLANGHSVVVVDCDYVTQDLSRFLQARPFINENLQNLFDRNLAITKESVEDCLVQVWEDEEKFKCMPPILENDALYDSQSTYPRTFLGILETLDGLFDFVIVDVADVKNAMLRALLRVVDELVFVINNDPVALYAAVNRLMQFKNVLSVEASLTIVENDLLPKGLSASFLRQEINNAAQLSAKDAFIVIPQCVEGGKWAASGGTLYSRASNRTVKAFKSLVDRMVPDELKQQSRSNLLPVLQTLIRRQKVKNAAPVKQIKAKEEKTDLLGSTVKVKALPAPVEEEEAVQTPEVEKLQAKGKKASFISGVRLFSE